MIRLNLSPVNSCRNRCQTFP